MDGKVKLWRLHAASVPRSGKRSPAVIGLETGYIECVFSSEAVVGSFDNRSDSVKRRQNGTADSISIVRYDALSKIVCGVTNDGDLRVWYGAGMNDEVVIRVDIGSEDECGSVVKLEMDVTGRLGNPEVSILVLREGKAEFTRYDLVPDREAPVKRISTYTAPVIASISTLQAYLAPASPITLSSALSGAKLDILGTPPTDATSPTATPPPFTLSLATEETDPIAVSVPETFGRFVVAGDQDGLAYIWAWDSTEKETEQIYPIRAWAAMTSRITSIDVSCGLVAVGRYVNLSWPRQSKLIP
jgi:hypothetical protein